MKKLISTFLMFAVIVCMITATAITASAAEIATQDGIEVCIATDKDSYASADDINVTVSVKNTNTYDVNGVDVIVELPEGLSLKSGELSVNDVDIKAGETYTKNVIAIKSSSSDGQKDKPSGEQTPSDKNEKKGDVSKEQSGANKNDKTTSPNTGDYSHLILWIILLAFSVAGIVLSFKYRKKATKVLSLFLCVAILVAVVPLSSIAAKESQNSICVEKGITVNGKEITLVAIVSYYDTTLLTYDETDSDNDGLFDIYELSIGTNINNKDTDGDSLSDYEEVILGLDPLMPNSFNIETDTDGDGLTDLDELRMYNTDPTLVDTDGDSLTDYVEITTYNTNPNLKDTDGDGLDDDFEIKKGLNPNNVCTDGITPDGEVKFMQKTDKTCLSSILLSDSNAAVPSLEGTTSGQLSKSIFIASASDRTISENRSTIGEPIFLDASDETVNGLKLNFNLEKYVDVGGTTSNLAVCKMNTDGEYTLIETNRESKSISCELDSAGTYFVLDLDLFLSGLGIDITEYNKPKAKLFAASTLSSQNAKKKTDGSSLSSTPDISGQADVVFAIDTTGSMGDEIAGVVSNVTSFAEALVKDYNVVANYALIDFKDLEEDGAGTTRTIKNGTSNWYGNVTSFADKVNSLSADGGGDDNECDIDALETARNLDFRSGASKFIILITDAGYKVKNDFGITSLEEEINLLKENGITVCVVTTQSLKSTYNPLWDSTGGFFADINEDFSTVLLELANGIGTEASGTWAILKHGYRYIQLPEDDSNDWDGDGLPNTYELGSKETINLTNIIKARLAISGVPFENYYGKTTIEVYNAISDPTQKDTDSDGILDKKDTAPWTKGLANGIVGAIKICSYGTGPSSAGNFKGHAFIAYTSFVDDNFELYGILVHSPDEVAKENDSRSDLPQTHNVCVSSNSLITIGGWAGWLPEQLKGTWINNELMLFGDTIPSQQRSLMAYLKDTDVQKFPTISINNSKWTELYNCSAYAVDFWNEVTGDDLSARGLFIYRNPASLSNNMEKRSNCKVEDSLIAVWP